MNAEEAEHFDVDKLTWAVLLARWVEFARSAVALPADGQGERMRQSVADIIMLQAVWFSLEHLEELAPGERALGLDRAELLIEKHEGHLVALWQGAMPEALQELVRDAHEALGKKKL